MPSWANGTYTTHGVADVVESASPEPHVVDGLAISFADEGALAERAKSISPATGTTFTVRIPIDAQHDEIEAAGRR